MTSLAPASASSVAVIVWYVVGTTTTGVGSLHSARNWRIGSGELPLAWMSTASAPACA